METKDEAMSLPNARLLSAVYFGLLAIIITIIIDTFLYLIGVEELVPTFQAVILATIVAAGFGALFGEKIIHSPKPYRASAFKWGFLMFLAALPVYDAILLVLMQQHHPESFRGASISQIVSLYIIVLGYSLILAGLWLAIIAGFAAIYLRGRLVYDIMHSDENEAELVHRHNTKTHTVKTGHR